MGFSVYYEVGETRRLARVRVQRRTLREDVGRSRSAPEKALRSPAQTEGVSGPVDGKNGVVGPKPADRRVPSN